MRNWAGGLGLLLALASPAFAQQAQAPIVGVTLADSGDTAWVMLATLLMLIMTIPGLLLFFAGQTATKHVLALATQIFAVVAAVSLLWIAIGYSLALGEATTLLGGLDNAFLANLAELRVDTTIPESGYAFYQMVLAVFAALLLIGAAADRARFGWMLALALLWSLCVYVPIAHWFWGNGWLADLGAHDYAGGVVVDAAAGVSALMIALMIKPRLGFGQALDGPHSPVLMLAGVGLLWVGTLASIGGAALTASDDAASAMINTHLSACAAALVWAAIAQLRTGKTSAVDLVRGAISGLVAAAAAAGYIGPIGAIVLGAIVGAASALSVPLMKRQFGIDDGANVFAIFGVAGLVGAVLFPIFVPILGGPGFEQGVTMTNQLLAQAIAVGAVVLWSAIVTLILGLGITLVIPMRVSEAEKARGTGNGDVTIGI